MALLALIALSAACGGGGSGDELKSELGRDYALFIRGAIRDDGALDRICGDMRDVLVSGAETSEERDDGKKLDPVCAMAEDGDTDGALDRLAQLLEE